MPDREGDFTTHNSPSPDLLEAMLNKQLADSLLLFRMVRQVSRKIRVHKIFEHSAKHTKDRNRSATT